MPLLSGPAVLDVVRNLLDHLHLGPRADGDARGEGDVVAPEGDLGGAGRLGLLFQPAHGVG